MNNKFVKLSMDKNLRNTYEGLVNLMSARYTWFNF
jgi:hypothetical protein